MMAKPWDQGHGMDTATCVLFLCARTCFTHFYPRLKNKALSVFEPWSQGESNSNSHSRLHFKHDNKPPPDSTDTIMRKICHHQQKPPNVWVWSLCMLMCTRHRDKWHWGNALLFFFNGRAADGGIILLGALPVFCAVLKEKHIFIMTTIILA